MEAGVGAPTLGRQLSAHFHPAEELDVCVQHAPHSFLVRLERPDSWLPCAAQEDAIFPGKHVAADVRQVVNLGLGQENCQLSLTFPTPRLCRIHTS